MDRFIKKAEAMERALFELTQATKEEVKE